MKKKKNHSFCSNFIHLDLHYRKHCGEVYKSGDRISDVYVIDPDGSGTFDQTSPGGGGGGGGEQYFKRDWTAPLIFLGVAGTTTGVALET